MISYLRLIKNCFSSPAISFHLYFINNLLIGLPNTNLTSLQLFSRITAK